MLKEKIVFIGAGNMGIALIKGILDAKLVKKGNITASDKKKNRLNYLKKKMGVKIETNNRNAVTKGNIIVLAVKPKDIKTVLKDIGDNINKKIIISIAAGVNTKTIENIVGPIPVIRVMPNTPALVKKGMAAISRGKFAKKKDELIAYNIFNSVGKAIIVNEKHLDAVTALSGSGPAYIFYLMESMIDAGVKLGLSRKIVKDLVFQTVLGSAELVLQTGISPKALRKAVSSPGGTTMAGLDVLKKKSFRKALIIAIEAAFRRSKELCK